MKLKCLIATAALVLMPLLSHAGVVYEWHALNNETPRGITLLLEFDEATVNSGSFSYEYSGLGDPSNWIPADVGLISLSFLGGGSIGFFKDAGKGQDGPYPSYLNMQIHFGKNLSGSIWASSFETEVKMSSNGPGPVFEITSLISDAPLEMLGCSDPHLSCSGATGIIRRVNNVPEPGSIALFGAGLFAASRFRRKKLLS